MLQVSTRDPEGSIGFVQYRIKPLAGLEVGTLIENTAHIFFDFNEAIVTNTTQNLFTTTTGVAEVSVLGVQVFPNPGSGQYQVLLRGAEAGATWMEVYDAASRRVLEQRAAGALSMLDLTAQPAGVYLLRVWNAQGSGVVRVVKQ
ncbi:MAG: T9SS type A sorting domain-containing protein [Flavobacteriales bacterium]|nr:T9SS type A sorting domain-containing protein [Flavobacteriales bacterium]